MYIGQANAAMRLFDNKGHQAQSACIEHSPVESMHIVGQQFLAPSGN